MNFVAQSNFFLLFYELLGGIKLESYSILTIEIQSAQKNLYVENRP